jgi:hypothetical protein
MKASPGISVHVPGVVRENIMIRLSVSKIPLTIIVVTVQKGSMPRNRVRVNAMTVLSDRLLQKKALVFIIVSVTQVLRRWILFSKQDIPLLVNHVLLENTKI